MSEPLATLVWRQARRVLAERRPDDAAEILKSAGGHHRRRRAQLPAEETLGARHMLLMASACAALHDALRERGVEPDAAVELVGEVAAQVYDLGLIPAQALVRPLAALGVRAAALVPLMKRFPFNPPAWKLEEVAEGARGASFDMKRCPLADYLRPEGLGALCEAAFCAGDHLLARRLGMRLERTELLSRGSPRCDFRWQ